MHPNLKHLIDLQAIDLRRAELRSSLAALPARLAEADRRAASARAALDRARAALTAGLTERKKFELDVEEWKGRVRKYKDQEAQVRSNEAYRALLHEIENAQAEVARAEDRLLDRMMALEDTERQVKQAERELAEIEAAVAAERAAIAQEKAALEKELAERDAERDRARAAVNEDLLAQYERIARKHAGIGLSAVGEDQTCGQCRVRVRPHVFEALRNPANEDIFLCETCTRILYYSAPAARSQEA